MKERPVLFSAPMVNAILAGAKTQTRRIMKVQPPTIKHTLLNIIKSVYGLKNWQGARFWSIPDGVQTDGQIFSDSEAFKCPYGEVGDRLWVREAWAAMSRYDGVAPRKICCGAEQAVWYRATDHKECDHYLTGQYRGKWRPSIFMPRWASRITLQIDKIRVERINDISEVDAIAEGVESYDKTPNMSGYRNYLWHGAVGRDITQKQSDAWDWQYSNYDATSDRPARDSFSSLWEMINADRGYGWDKNPWVWVYDFSVVQQGGG